MSHESVYGAQPVRPGIDRPEELLRFSPRDGTVHSHTGGRAVLASDDFIITIGQALQEELGPAASRIMYEAGHRWGWQDMQNFVPLLEQAEGTKLQDMEAGELLKRWWQTLQAQGWGRWQVDMSQRRDGLLLVDLFDSAIVRGWGTSEKAVCHVYAGLFAGMFSYLTRTDLSCLEIRCAAQAGERCSFLTGTAKRITVARDGLAAGSAAEEIIRLAAGS